MLEIDVTHMVRDRDDMIELSGSCMEHGPNAGPITWNNSRLYARDHPLLKTPEEIAEARDYFRDFGAWTDDEIDAWTVDEVQAITVQEVASRIREMEHYQTYRKFIRASHNGHASGVIYRVGPRWFASLSH